MSILIWPLHLEDEDYRTEGSSPKEEVYSAGDMQSPDYECGIWVPVCRPGEKDGTADIVSTMTLTGIL